MINLFDNYDHHMAILWLSHEYLMDIWWLSHKLLMDMSWLIHGYGLMTKYKYKVLLGWECSFLWFSRLSLLFSLVKASSTKSKVWTKAELQDAFWPPSRTLIFDMKVYLRLKNWPPIPPPPHAILNPILRGGGNQKSFI